MKKATKQLIGFVSILIIFMSQFGLSIFCLKNIYLIQPIFQANSLPIRIIFGFILYVFLIALTIIGPLFIFGAGYINLISLLELKFYLAQLEEREAAKFLARLIWLSTINVRKYPGNEYLIYRMFYPQAELIQKNGIIWVVKINYKKKEFLVDNGFGKPSYYKEKYLYQFIIKPIYPSYYEKILQMTNFLKQNFLSDLTDAQINSKLDELFIQ